MKYYRRNVGDYMSKTASLSLAEHGAYTLLLDTYYSTMTPLPSSIDALARMCRAMSKAEQAAVRSVAEAFFPVGEDGLRHNKRADEEIEKAKSAIEKQRASGLVSARKRWGPNGSSGGVADDEDVGFDTSGDDYTCRSTHGSTHESTHKVPNGSTGKVQIQPQSLIQKTKSKDLSVPDDFDRFWAAYPRKEAKAKAIPAFRKQRAGPAVEAILADLVARRSEWTDRQFIPLPASYLNARRWEDDRGAECAEAGFGMGAV